MSGPGDVACIFGALLELFHPWFGGKRGKTGLFRGYSERKICRKLRRFLPRIGRFQALALTFPSGAGAFEGGTAAEKWLKDGRSIPTFGMGRASAISRMGGGFRLDGE